MAVFRRRSYELRIKMNRMNKAPNLVTLRDIAEGKYNDNMTGINEKWVPARPVGYFSLRSRFKLAWNVFNGTYDALKWPEGQ
jgi:hypothetical protein